MNEKPLSAHAFEHRRAWVARLERLGAYLTELVSKRRNDPSTKQSRTRQSKASDSRSES